MDAVVHVFTGSALTTTMSTLNPADSITNIELAEDQYKGKFINNKKADLHGKSAKQVI